MGIKIKLVRDNEPVLYYREPVDLVPVIPTDTSDLVTDAEQLWIKRAIQQLKAEIRQQEIEELRRKYNL